MQELVVNLHIHSIYSDGSGTYQDIADAALNSGIDVAIITDHNIHVNGLERYNRHGERKILVLTGEEIHDPQLTPSRNHLLVLGGNRDYAPFAADTQELIDAVNQDNGICFLAHPYDKALPFAGENNIPWVNWQVQGFSGIEIWNVMSEFKGNIRNIAQALLYAYFPSLAIRSADRDAISTWDAYLTDGQKLVAIGGSDAHSRRYSLGPLRATLFPYSFHFQAVNTHVLTARRLSDNLENDKRMVIDALRSGHAFISNDLLHPAQGFLFTAHDHTQEVIMGDDIFLNKKVTFDIQVPKKCRCQLMRYGQLYRAWSGKEFHQVEIDRPGVYRIECFLFYRGRRRGWIYSNPIYVTKQPSHRR